jgi:molybdopterin-guanine dinucleotide biosynthesis protein A
VVPPRELAQELVPVQQRVQALAAELVPERVRQRVRPVQALVHRHCHQQLQSRCQQEQCHLQQHESQ